MNNYQLEFALKSNKITSPYFRGIFTIDTISCIEYNKKGFYVINNDTKNGNGK